MRILRAVYNRCVERGLTENNDPFRRVYTGIARTAKRALTLDEMRRLKNLTTDDEALAMARDLFLFSFYTRGMSFVDIAYLRKADVRDGVLSYKRRKTGQLLTLAWEPKMQEIVDRHPALCTQYLLPIIHTVNGRERNQYRNRQTRVNVALKEVARLAGIGRKLTMYCARHSWATIARQVGVSVDVISRGMGHNSRRTTEIYLSTVDVKTIDKANRQIMDEL
jgi:integrase